MKKICVIMVMASTLATEFKQLSDWSFVYMCLDPCGNTVLVSHGSDIMMFVDKDTNTYMYGLDTLKIKKAPNGCFYNVMLEYNTTVKNFESTLLNAGFEVIEKDKL